MADLRSCWPSIFVLFSARSAVGIGDSSGAFLDGGGGWILGLLFLIWWGAGSGVCMIIGLSGGIPCLKLPTQKSRSYNYSSLYFLFSSFCYMH